MKRIGNYSLILISVILSACVTVGYSYAKDPTAVKKWNATIVSIEDQNIYDSTGAMWVGPLATVNSVGQKVKFVTDSGETVSIVQPKSNKYTLTAGQHVIYIVDQGHVWVQPTDYPLPADFNTQPNPTK